MSTQPFCAAPRARARRPSPSRSSRGCCARRGCSMRSPRSASFEGAACRSNSCSPDPIDPDNRGSLTVEELSSLTAEPGDRMARPGRRCPDRVAPRGHRRAALDLWRRACRRRCSRRPPVQRPIVATRRPRLPRGRASRRDRHPCARATSTGWPRPSPRSPAIRLRRSAMGRAGRALVEREFAEEIVARETLALYHTALRERAAPR